MDLGLRFARVTLSYKLRAFRKLNRVGGEICENESLQSFCSNSWQQHRSTACLVRNVNREERDPFLTVIYMATAAVTLYMTSAVAVRSPKQSQSGVSGLSRVYDCHFEGPQFR